MIIFFGGALTWTCTSLLSLSCSQILKSAKTKNITHTTVQNFRLYMALLYMVFTMPLYYALSEYCSETGAAVAGVELIAEIFFFRFNACKTDR